MQPGKSESSERLDEHLGVAPPPGEAVAYWRTRATVLVRSALGAGRLRLVQLQFIETALIGSRPGSSKASCTRSRHGIRLRSTLVPLFLIAVPLAACLSPARAAARIDPIAMLRLE
jgi:hypothetical protein